MTADISSLIARAGGQVTGKVRLQKMVYLLDQLGFESGYSFEYHHYGPYSAGLAEQLNDDVVFGYLRATTKHRSSDGATYVAFESNSPGDGEKPDAHISPAKLDSALMEFAGVSATVLELAATIHWLSEVEGLRDWQSELVKRKGSKTDGGRTDKALKLLTRLGLEPAANRGPH